MATIQSLSTLETAQLSSHHRIGSLPGNDLCVLRPFVSSTHATIEWRSEAWRIHDLDSRNGTFVEGRRLASGEHLALRGDELIAFGDPTEAWRVIDLSPPALFARNSGGAMRLASGGVLALPDDDHPTVQVFQRGDVWIAEQEGDTWEVSGTITVRIDGATWVVHCPTSQEDTAPREGALPLLLRRITLRFAVNDAIDPTSVRLSLVTPEGRVELGARAYNHMLLRLAQERLADATRFGTGEGERGWMRRSVLLDDLDLDDGDLNLLDLYVCKARRELAERGVLDAQGVIERRRCKPLKSSRRPTPELRLGVAAIEIVVD